jgi:hypothetical protein
MIRLVRLILLALTPLIACDFALADAPAKNSASSVDTKLMRQLATPFQGVISGLTVRQACDSIAQSTQVNYWLHPSVDPSRMIEIPQSNWSVWDVLEKISDQAEAEIFPVAGVVIIGKQPWVHQFVKDHLSLSRIELIDVDWPALTTPEEAWEKVAKKKSDFQLPHDLWPAVRWKSIDRQVAMDLVDCRRKIEPQTPSSARCFYPLGTWTDAVKDVDPNAKVSGPSSGTKTGSRSIETTVEGHRAIRRAWIQAFAANADASTQSSKFSIRVTSRANDVLQQLSAKNGCTLQWDPAIDQATKDKPVSFEAQDATLEEIGRMVAQRIDLELKVQNQTWLVAPSQ